MDLCYGTPDHSRAEKSYRAASIQRDHLTAGALLALGNLDDLHCCLGDRLSWEVEQLLKRAQHDLTFALDAAETCDEPRGRCPLNDASS